MSRQVIRFTIPLDPVTKKNSARILRNRRTGRPFVAPSETFEKYEGLAGWYLQGVRNLNINAPVNVQCVYYMGTRRRCDLVNLQEATLDVMVEYGVIADDNYTVVRSMDGSRVLYDKERPRTEVTISFYDSSP